MSYGATFIQYGGALISHLEWHLFNDNVNIVYEELDIIGYKALMQ